jgi:uncharacterized phage protein gp47/JayE
MAPNISLNDLLNPRSAQQIYNDQLDYIATPPDPNLVSVSTANWRTGGPYKTILSRVSIEGGLVYQILSYFAGSAFLRYASGRWLDWLGQDLMGEDRQDAEFATVNLVMTIPAGAGPYGPLQVTAQTADGKAFSSISTLTIPAGPATITIPMRASLAGAAYNVGANTITQLVSPNILGLSVTNPAAAIGGFDEEPDDRYRQRLQAKWGVLSTGSTQAAYVYWALTASKEVKKVRVYSNLKGGVFAAEWVTVVLAGLNSGVSAQAVADVTAYTEPRIPLNAKLAVESAVVKSITVTGNVKIFTPYIAAAPSSIANSLQDLNVRVPIGSYDAGPVPVSEVARAVAYDPTQVYDVSLSNPTSPISLAYNELMVLSNGTTPVPV